MPRCSTAILSLLCLCIAACASHESASSSNSAAASGAKPCTMTDGRHDVLRVSPPADAPCDASPGSLAIRSRQGHVFIWLVPGATSVDDAVSVVAKTIESEFKRFKTTRTSTLTLPGEKAPATRLMGSGVEADDDDPGTADVIVFRRGSRVFIACAHGEHLRDSAQQLLLSLVESSSVP